MHMTITAVDNENIGKVLLIMTEPEFNASQACLADDRARLYPINGGWHSSHPVDNTVPSAMGQHSQSVILKVSKTIRSP